MDSKFLRFSSSYQSFLSWMQRVNFSRKLGYFLIFSGVILGILTYLALTRETALGVNSKDIILLLNLDLGVFLLLSVLVAKRGVTLWVKRKQGLAGSRLHVRLVVLLSVLTVTPAIVMAVLSGLFLNAGVHTWFSKRVQTALNQSSAVAEAYLDEHKEVIRANVEAFRRDISENLGTLISDKDLFNSYIDKQSHIRNLSEAIVFDSTPDVLARSRLTFALEFEFVTKEDLEKSARDVVVLTSDERDRVRALVKIDPEVDIYLLVGRIVDSQILKRIDDTENAISDYRLIESSLSDIKIKFAIIFSTIALMLLIISIWFGLSYANQLARPISRLLEATDKVRKGDLSARVVVEEQDSDLGILSSAFNRMTKWIQKQQKQLLLANDDLDHRRRFIEAVLSGVSAGVIGLDKNKRINLANKSASELLSIDLSNYDSKHLTKVAPEMKAIFDIKTPHNFTQTEVEIKREGYNRKLLVRVVEEKGETEMEGFIVTFDDITDLIQAQKTAAWSDVARRIAHEIKNPLTPIQLSAERLSRKYGKQITEDKATFEKCIETISRQVEHMGNMVSEFSDFAKMPASKMRKTNIIQVIKNSILLVSQEHPTIGIACETDKSKLNAKCDPNQIEQVMINLLQNAADSVVAKSALTKKSISDGIINIKINEDENTIVIRIQDNGLGFPSESREKLLDPYVTNKEKGTGLGLAIVKRIIEDHNGSIKLDNVDSTGGAIVTITLPKVL